VAAFNFVFFAKTSIKTSNMYKQITLICCTLFCVSFCVSTAFAQNKKDSTRFSIHFQQTIITQSHSKFAAPYEGKNSLRLSEDPATSLTGTFFLGARLWQNGAIFINPEIAGGAGLSGATGVAGFPNGETFRVGNVAPTLYIARAYYQQIFALKGKAVYQHNAANQLGGVMPENYYKISVGKFCLADFFDKNSYSHDPRTQFMNWALMTNGAYDYAANVRGYTWGAVGEANKGHWTLRAGAALQPLVANGADLDWNINKAIGLQAEVERRFLIKGKLGVVRLLGYYNTSSAASYATAIEKNPKLPDLVAVRSYGNGNRKNGVGINMEQAINNNGGIFLKASWNDGKYETWAFTEIDHSIAGGWLQGGARWHRPNDQLGVAVVANGLSVPHQDYLRAGGNGFIVGDGQLNYGFETIFEAFYNFDLYRNKIIVAPDYQFVVNPAYNKDRGPVSFFGFRLHTEF
jgi:high affinity Mn2+ porin